jgi:hypothetical protein
MSGSNGPGGAPGHSRAGRCGVDRKPGPCASEDRADLGWAPCVGHHKLKVGGAAIIRLESLSAAFRLELTSVQSGH